MQRTTLWQRLTFSDVNPLIRKFSKIPAELEDLQSVPFVQNAVKSSEAYPSYEEALPKLRKSVFFAVPHFERKSLWYMLLIHISDVHLSIFGALLSVQILRTFEPNEGQTRFIDAVVTDPTPLQVLLFGTGLAFFIFLVNVLATSLHAQKIEREMLLSYRIQGRLSEFLFQHVLGMSRQDRIKFQTGDLVNLGQTDARNVAAFYSHAMVDFPVLFVSVTVIMVVMYLMLGNAAWVGFFLVLLQIPISWLFSKIATRLSDEYMRRSDSRISLITEWIQGMRLVRYFGWRNHFESEIKRRALSEFRQDLKLKSHYTLAFALSMSWWMVVTLGIFASLLYFQAGKNASQIFAAIWLTTILGHQLTPLPWFVISFSEARVGGKRLTQAFQARRQEEEFVENEKSAVDSQQQNSAKRAYGGVGFELNNVTVKFSESDVPVLKNISFVVPPGTTTAIVGPVGAGKSVLLQTIMGDITPTSGTVVITTPNTSEKLNVHSRAGLTLLRESQAYVPQEAFIASATIRENVPLLYLESNQGAQIRDNDVLNSLYAAQMESDMRLFSSGLNTELGERGVNLSGGQKQRLSLARGAFASSRVIVLDDPLSAVDKDTEEDLVDALFKNRWNKGQTILWSTHRLDYLSVAHQVVFIENGELVECGTFEALMKKRGSRLRRFVESRRESNE